MVYYMLDDGISAGRVAEIMSWPIGDVIARARFRDRRNRYLKTRKPPARTRPPLQFYEWVDGLPVLASAEIRNGVIRRAVA